VDDLTDALVRLMDTADDFVGPVNIGNPRSFTMLELAQKITQLTGSRSELVFRPLPSDDPVQRQPDISLANKKLRWRPSIELDQGLERTIDYFRQRIQEAA
ncbi:MAG: SDR family NAD-dependent epimerase/dehydratase, partial [Burkholderiales bacterium]